jgi:hypothetical protein
MPGSARRRIAAVQARSARDPRGGERNPGIMTMRSCTPEAGTRPARHGSGLAQRSARFRREKSDFSCIQVCREHCRHDLQPPGLEEE